MPSVEEEEENKFKSKYPGLDQRGVGSLMLQKRLNRGHKYFDSGDYNMAKAKILKQKPHVLPAQTEEAILHESTGDTIATPDSVPAVRKKSVVVSAPGEPPNTAIPGTTANCPPSPTSHLVSDPVNHTLATHQTVQYSSS